MAVYAKKGIIPWLSHVLTEFEESRIHAANIRLKHTFFVEGREVIHITTMSQESFVGEFSQFLRRSTYVMIAWTHNDFIACDASNLTNGINKLVENIQIYIIFIGIVNHVS